MRLHHGLFLDALENGAPLAVKAAAFALAALVVLLTAIPIIAAGARIVA